VTRPRVLLIWNPVSTGVDADAIGAVLVAAAEHVDLVAMHTREAGDAGRLADEAVADGYSAVFVLGGDGTANEVLNGIGDRLPIGVLPAGGTSVLPRALMLPSALAGCAGHLATSLVSGSIRTVTLGTLNERRFAFAAGIGIDAEVVQRIDERGRGGDGTDAKRPGDLLFVREAIAVLLRGDYAEPRMRLVCAGVEDPLSAMTIFVANCDPWSYAGSMPIHLAPDADFESGLEIVAVVEPIKLQTSLSRLISLVRRGDDSGNGSVRRFGNLERARIVCDQPTPVQVDGELIGELAEIELGVVPRGAHFIV
jgi:diacylglycerol kinase family enzyme